LMIFESPRSRSLSMDECGERLRSTWFHLAKIKNNNGVITIRKTVDLFKSIK
jgi:hypothetical protein